MTTIITKHGSGAPTAGQLSQGELAVDLTNKELYTKDSGGNVIKVGSQGGSSGTFTDLVATDSFTSPGIDDNATSTAITIDANQRVGVGTTTPSRILHVENDGLADLLLRDTSSYSAGTGPAVIFQGKDSGDTNIQFGAIYGVSNGANSGEITFETRNSGSSDERMRISAAGNVGIGTASPSAGLDVRKTVASTTGVNVDRAIQFLNSAGTGSAILGVETGGTTAYLQAVTSGADLGFAVRTGEAMRIDSIGNVGIGMTSPTDRNLSVYGTTNCILSMHNSTTGTTAASGFQLQGVGDNGYLVNYSAGGVLGFFTAATANDTKERMRIDSNGNVGINGTPGTFGGGAEKLQVAGDGYFTNPAGVSRLSVVGGVGSGGVINLGDTADSSCGSLQGTVDVFGKTMAFYSGAGGPKAYLREAGELLINTPSLSTVGAPAGTKLAVAGTAHFTGTVKAPAFDGTLVRSSHVIQDGAPVVDSLQIIRAFMKLRDAVDDPDSSVEELRDKLKVAVV
ncbi:MAG: hypothetical protein P8J32_02160, partial [bacterium]|nr:hypothetical protein [bacterium]